MDSALMLMQQDTLNQSTTVQTAPGAKAGIRSEKGQALTPVFKEILKDYETMDVWAQIVAQLGLPVDGGGNQTENSRANGSADRGIVGTLEGFGLLEDQANGNNPVLTGNTLQNGSAVQMPMAHQSNGQTQAGVFREAVMPDTTGEPLPEQSAGMLINNQPGSLPKEIQQQAQRVGEYLCSFESTNSQVSKKTSLPKTSDTSNLPSKYSAVETNASPDQTLRAMTLVKKEGAVGPAGSKAEVTVPAQPQKEPPAKEPPAKEGPQKELPAKEGPVKEGPAKEGMVIEPSAGHSGELRVVETTAENAADKPEAAPLTKENVFRIVDKAVATIKDGRQDFEVQLKPDFLGKVSIKLMMEDGKMKMQVKTDDMAVKGLFADQMPALETALKDKGIVMSNIDVIYENLPSSGSEQQQAFQQNSRDSRQKTPDGGFTADRLAGSDQYDSPVVLQGLLFGNSTVEFRA